MGRIGRPAPVMLFVGMLSGERACLDEAGKILEEHFGPVLHKSQDAPWNFTDYYRAELGEKILRRFLFFEELMEPGRLARIKLLTNALEERYARPHAPAPLRRINLDPGYLNAAKVVLASTKDYAHRIYLGEGIYGEVTLTFRRGNPVPMPHTYPDYRSPEVRALFHAMRNHFMERRREKK